MEDVLPETLGDSLMGKEVRQLSSSINARSLSQSIHIYWTKVCRTQCGERQMVLEYLVLLHPQLSRKLRVREALSVDPRLVDLLDTPHSSLAC